MIVSSGDPLTLVLTPDNPCNSVLTDSETGKDIYRVWTEHSDGGRAVTKIERAGDRVVIASWEWKDVRTDTLTIGQATPLPVSAWLKKSIMPFRDSITFKDPAGNEYKWKGNSPGLSLELYSSSDKSSPIARCVKQLKYKRKGDDGTTTEKFRPPSLLVDRRGEDILDLIVISFLILEKERRAIEGSTMNRADVLGTPSMQVGTNYVLKNGGV
ncbi:hypothetical protein AX16_010188 [Volvariella volvacea WC 439]|nr:hypothetical protein AX16_010188 [Volvariella volvacea WC 439]